MRKLINSEPQAHCDPAPATTLSVKWWRTSLAELLHGWKIIIIKSQVEAMVGTAYMLATVDTAQGFHKRQC